MSERRKKKATLPTKQQVLEFIRESPTPVGKREIARAFGISGGDRIALKAMLKEIAAEGAVERGRGRRKYQRRARSPACPLASGSRG
jgi:ribonuclease R